MRSSTRSFSPRLLAAAVIAAAGLALPATAQTTTTETSSAPARRSVNPKRDTLLKMQRTVTIELEEQRLEDVMRFIREITGADLEVVWLNDRTSGLDPEQLITVSVKGRPALELLEKVLDKAEVDFTQNTWQMTEHGTMQVGPKDVLNRDKRVEIYDINDLLFVVPRYDQVPEIDLEAVLQQSEGGQGQSPFEDDDDEEEERTTREERAEELADLIRTIVETEQWIENGGEGGSIRYWQGTLIVNAPDYMHRQINGYAWWPASHTARVVEGRRYVTLNVDTSIGTVDGFEQYPVTGVVPGRQSTSARRSSG